MVKHQQTCSRTIFLLLLWCLVSSYLAWWSADQSQTAVTAERGHRWCRSCNTLSHHPAESVGRGVSCRGVQQTWENAMVNNEISRNVLRGVEGRLIELLPTHHDSRSVGEVLDRSTPGCRSRGRFQPRKQASEGRGIKALSTRSCWG